VLNFYQINWDSEIRTRDITKALISYQITNSTQKLKLLCEVPKYNLYYFLKKTFENYFFNFQKFSKFVAKFISTKTKNISKQVVIS
jgi:hypothetical protein